MRKLAIACLCVFMLTGCGTTCLQKVAATEAAITEAYSLNGKLYRENVIGKEDALNILKGIDAANVAADRAAPLCRIDNPTAKNYLNQASVALFDVMSKMEDYQ